jgi:hypothetical protein
MYFDNGSSGWAANARKAHAVHELEHLMGMDHNVSSCDKSDSVMKNPGGTCGSPGAGYAVTPTKSDIDPLWRTVYSADPSLYGGQCPNEDPDNIE